MDMGSSLSSAGAPNHKRSRPRGLSDLNLSSGAGAGLAPAETQGVTLDEWKD